jgi:hypothetical protein
MKHGARAADLFSGAAYIRQLSALLAELEQQMLTPTGFQSWPQPKKSRAPQV